MGRDRAERNSLSLSREKGSWLLCEVMRSTQGQVSALIYTLTFSLSLVSSKYNLQHESLTQALLAEIFKKQIELSILNAYILNHDSSR